MGVEIVELDGKRYAILPETEFRQLSQRAGQTDDQGEGPPLPKLDEQDQVPALQYARASLARKIIRARRIAGLSQAELARQAGIRPETLNRIEKGKTTPNTATVVKIQRALDRDTT